MARKRWKKVVAHYADGSLLKGRTSDFRATHDTFHICDTSKNEHLVSVSDLKAVFFVTSLEGDPSYRERKGFHKKRKKYKKVMVEFSDGELLFGFTDPKYTGDGPGLFMFPGDPNSNNIKVFIVRAATKRVRVRDQEQQEEVFS